MSGGGQTSGHLGASVAVVLLLALIWAMVLVPPALVSRAARREAFVVSFGTPAPVQHRAGGVRSSRVRCRRQIAGGLLLAAVATLLIGLLPTFRVLLVVHLFLVDSLLAYIALLTHVAQRRARAGAQMAGDAPGAEEPRTRARLRPQWRGRVVRRRAPLPGLGPARVG